MKGGLSTERFVRAASFIALLSTAGAAVAGAAGVFYLLAGSESPPEDRKWKAHYANGGGSGKDGERAAFEKPGWHHSARSRDGVWRPNGGYATFPYSKGANLLRGREKKRKRKTRLSELPPHSSTFAPANQTLPWLLFTHSRVQPTSGGAIKSGSDPRPEPRRRRQWKNHDLKLPDQLTKPTNRGHDCTCQLVEVASSKQQCGSCQLIVVLLIALFIKLHFLNPQKSQSVIYKEVPEGVEAPTSANDFVCFFHAFMGGIQIDRQKDR